MAAYQPVDQIPSNINPAAVQAARIQWNNGDYAGAWSTLAQAGDRYADNAAMVLNVGTDAAGQFFYDLVQNHWADTVGAPTPSVTLEYFNACSVRPDDYCTARAMPNFLTRERIHSIRSST